MKDHGAIFGLRVIESDYLPEGVEGVIVDQLPALDPSSMRLKFDKDGCRVETLVRVPRPMLVFRRHLKGR